MGVVGRKGMEATWRWVGIQSEKMGNEADGMGGEGSREGFAASLGRRDVNRVGGHRGSWDTLLCPGEKVKKQGRQGWLGEHRPGGECRWP